MKRRVLSALSVVLLLALLLTLVGCQKKVNLVGTWEGTLDFSDAIADSLAGDDDNMAEYFDVKDFVVTLRLTFRDDGTYKLEVDENSVKEAFSDMKDSLREGMTAYIDSLLEGSGLSLDAALSVMGVSSLEELLDALLSEEMLDAMLTEMRAEGNYKAVNGKLFTSDGVNNKIDESEFQSFALSGNELRLLKSEGSENDLFAGMYPIILKKVA